MTNRSRTLSDDATERLQDLPPSAKLVAKTLEYEGELTQGELVDQTRLPPRTVRHAVSDLETHDLIETTISFSDARKRQYVIAEEAARDRQADGECEGSCTEQSPS